jgi:NADPH-dependent 2,4-dienoyl-CoA reductase/sulfur reductase-like enzyme
VRWLLEQADGASVARFARSLVRTPRRVLEGLRYAASLETRPRTRAWVIEATGSDHVREVTFVIDGRKHTDTCDLLCCGFGLVPNTEIAALLGCAIRVDSVVVDGEQRTTVPGVYAVGETTGVGGLDLALIEGELAGRSASGAASPDLHRIRAKRARARAFAETLGAAFRLRDELRSLAGAETIVCRCESVPLGRLSRAWTMRQAKLYTRAGMGPCQGRVCGAALQFLYGWEPDTIRSPVTPATIEALTDDPVDPATAGRPSREEPVVD